MLQIDCSVPAQCPPDVPPVHSDDLVVETLEAPLAVSISRVPSLRSCTAFFSPLNSSSNCYCVFGPATGPSSNAQDANSADASSIEFFILRGMQASFSHNMALTQNSGEARSGEVWVQRDRIRLIYASPQCVHVGST